jgi:hypothetical protein
MSTFVENNRFIFNTENYFPMDEKDAVVFPIRGTAKIVFSGGVFDFV